MLGLQTSLRLSVMWSLRGSTWLENTLPSLFELTTLQDECFEMIKSQVHLCEQIMLHEEGMEGANLMALHTKASVSMCQCQTVVLGCWCGTCSCFALSSWHNAAKQQSHHCGPKLCHACCLLSPVCTSIWVTFLTSMSSE